MDRVARPSRFERPLVYWLTPVVSVAIVVGVVGLVRHVTAPRTLTGKLERWIGDDTPGCDPKRERVTPAADPYLYHGRFGALLTQARTVTRVTCVVPGGEGGPLTFVLAFDSPDRLEQALAHSRGEWCIAGDEAFDGRFLDPGELKRFCGRVGGRVRPRPTPPAGP